MRTFTTTRAGRTALGILGMLFSALVAGFATPAKAEIVSLSATGFVKHCPCVDDGTPESNENNGVLEMTGQFSRFYEGVDFPKEGERVCSMSLVYRDVNGNDAIRARLYKKSFSSGGPAFAAPVLMATATSAAGTPDTVRIAKTSAINQPSIAQGGAFYYLLVDAPTINLAFLGVQIDVKGTC